MRKLIIKLFTVLSLTEVALGWLGWIILMEIFPEDRFNWYPFVPLFFFVLAACTLLLLYKNRSKEGKKIVNIYMLIKLSKLVLSMVFLLCFYFIVGEDLKIFGLVFAVFYALYIGLETYCLTSFEKQLKNTLPESQDIES